MRHSVTSSVLCLALLLTPCLRTSVQAQQTSCNYDFAPVTKLMQDMVKDKLLVGASLLLVKDNKTIYEQYFGAYDVNTQVLIASASKWLSAAAIMTLVDEGKLSLDDSASKHLSFVTGIKGTMTVRQMLSHTSGLPPLLQDHPCLLVSFLPLDSCARSIASLDLIGLPGMLFGYGENSFQIAGRIAEVVSGKSWETLFQERIAVPLGMSNTNFGNVSNPILAGGGRSRLRDYGNFTQMIANDGVFNGKRILSSNAIREMQKNLTGTLPVIYSPYGNNQPSRYGIGEWIDALDAQGNALQVSSQGAFGFSPWVDKQRKLQGVLLVQASLSSLNPTIQQLQRTVREIIDACPRPLANASAASYSSTALAPASIAAAFGANLANATLLAGTNPLPTTLGGTTVIVRDSAGVERAAPLFFVSPGQINYLLPPQTAAGTAGIFVSTTGSVLAGNTTPIAATAPGLFTADASGRGLAAATVLRVKSNGALIYEPVAQFNTTQNKFVAVPIDLSDASDQVFLLLFGTGLRGRSTLATVNAQMGGLATNVLYAGEQGSFAGLDQINLPISRTLQGRGEITVNLTVEGQSANAVTIVVK
jgi:serine-type D-Ala-D-Ala carboxypeptidase/endopeptidase